MEAEKAQAWSVEKPPFEILDNPAAQELFQIFLALRIEETVESHNAVFGETSIKLSTELAM